MTGASSPVGDGIRCSRIARGGRSFGSRPSGGDIMGGIFGETVTLAQENGPDVQLVAFGDESYGRHETKDGYTAIYDAARGLYCYAALKDGAFVSTGVSVDAAPPPGTRRHIMESEEA